MQALMRKDKLYYHYRKPRETISDWQ